MNLAQQLESKALGKELATMLAFSPPARYESGTSAVGSVGLIGSDFAAVAWDGKVHDTSVDLHADYWSMLPRSTIHSFGWPVSEEMTCGSG